MTEHTLDSARQFMHELQIMPADRMTVEQIIQYCDLVVLFDELDNPDPVETEEEAALFLEMER